LTAARAPAGLVLIGHPVSHSLSPRFQNAALRAAGISLTYESRDVAPGDLRAVLAELREAGAAGNITVPHKETAVALCARLTPVAHRVGAVNTFWVDAGALVGDNTDVGGFHHAVVGLRGGAPQGAIVGVLGAGGGAAAVLAAVADWPRCVARVWNRTPERAAALCARFAGIATPASSVAAAIAGATLVVHATTIGLTRDDVPMDPLLLPPGADVVDLAYRRGGTTWVRQARAHGHRAVDGLPMLIEQGALAFERWFGRPPDRAAMWDAVREQ
jgi:shikimate dehydrogenase